MELVLWLPILLFVMALMINYGTSAAWRLRGEIMSRNAVWEDRHHEDSNRGLYEDAATWPNSADASVSKSDDDPLESLADRSTYDGTDVIIRGPSMGDVQINDLFDPDVEGAYRSEAQITRRFPFLPSLGSYQSGSIENFAIERMWQSSEYGYRGANFLPHVGEYTRYGRFNPIGYPNRLRRSEILFDWDVASLEATFDMAWNRARSYEQSNRAAFNVLLGQDDWTGYFSKYRSRGRLDFYPKPDMRVVETDRDIVRETAVEWVRRRQVNLLDYRDSTGEVELGGITLLPRTLTNSYLGYFSSVKSRIEQLIRQLENADPQPPGAAAQLAELYADLDLVKGPIEDLEDFRDKLDEIEEDLKATSTAM